MISEGREAQKSHLMGAVGVSLYWFILIYRMITYISHLNGGFIMKSKLLLIALLSVVGMVKADWETFNVLKSDLCARQNFLGKDAYFKVINSGIEAAKKDLEIGRYVLRTQNLCDGVKAYMDAVVDFAVYDFNKPRMFKPALVRLNLEKAIEKVKKEANLNFDVKKELQKTIDLIKEMNVVVRNNVGVWAAIRRNF